MKESENTPFSANKKRVLLVNPAKDDEFKITRLHMGLSLLAEILITHGHHVKLIDYAFLRGIIPPIKIPKIEQLIFEFQPDIIGISVFTYLYDETQELLDKIVHVGEIPIILGGPHLAIFPEDFKNDTRVSYIVKGEAEDVIVNLVETAKQEQPPVFINAPMPSSDKIPAANLDVAYGSEYLKVYQIQLSRGCPYHCSFCNVPQLIAGRRVRARDIETCVDEIINAKKNFPNITAINIADDCPTFDRERFKRFLRMLRDAQIGCSLSVDNMRANLIDEEMLQLYKTAGGINICFGVESGHPDVFQRIHKGESLEEIVQAAKLVRKYGLSLQLCFVIGLPGDSLQRHVDSLNLAKFLKPDSVFWNMCVPWPGTDVHEWYRTTGQVSDLHNFSTLIDPLGNFKEPPAVSFDFSKDDRIKAWLMANMETHRYFRGPKTILKLLVLTWRYKLYKSFIIYFLKFGWFEIFLSLRAKIPLTNRLRKIIHDI